MLNFFSCFFKDQSVIHISNYTDVILAMNKSTESPCINSSNSDGIKENCPQAVELMKLRMNSSILSNVNNTEASINGKDSTDNVSTSNSEEQNLPLNNNSLCNLKQNYAVDNFKGESLHQLSTNALPPYNPGSPPTFMRFDIKSFDIHCCTDCGDTFAFKSSLNFHLNRRSVLIKFPCETCKNNYIFYNRCKLLSHIRNHTDKNESADLRKAVISVLPRVFMDGIQNDFVSTLDDELNSIEDNDIRPPSELLECSLDELDETVMDKEQNEPEKSTIVKVKCLDCNEEFDTAKERVEHLTNGDKMPVVVSFCGKCGLMCPSKCSLKAHQRIHLQISPYVCPECGESPDPHWANFLHHVNFKCFHNTRSVGYKCPVCKRVAPNNESLLKHMELHTERYAKCSECPRAYNSTPAFKAHNNVYHNGEELHYTVIYKCSLCDIVFVSRDQMLNHRSTHLKKVCEYVFNCMQCGKPLESKTMLMEHIKSTHPKIYKQNVQTEPLPTKPVTSTTVSYKGMVECLLCTATFYSLQGYSVHLSRTHINHNQECEYCNKVLPNRKEMVKHGKMHLENKAIICLLCNNRKMHNVKELDLHLDDHTKKLKFCSACPVCDHLFQNLPYAVNHLREEHFLPVRAPGSPNKEESVSSSSPLAFDRVCNFCRSPFANDEDLQIHLKQKHNVNNQTSLISPVSESTEQPLKKQRTEGNSCAKCDFNSSNREDFKKHILSHKSNQTTFQCQECGLCFVVIASLTKHLRIVHKISDTKMYVSKEGTNFIPDLESSTEVSKRSALECSVCFTSFPNETSLKTHMRRHGMAFIQANKSGLS